MKIRNEELTRWDLKPKEAMANQENLRTRILKEGNLARVSKVAGVDASYRGGRARAAVVVLSFPGLKLIDQRLAELPISFPYIPGLLAFREGPAVVEAFRQLETEPDLIIFDAHGVAHPRRLGLASHLGLILSKPSIGCAKSRLIGATREPLGDEGGCFVNLYDRGELVGAVVRSKEGTAPLYVSIGHKIGLNEAMKYVLACVKKKERLPETTILAHELAGRL